jgi:hypothetical protein
LLTVKVGEVDVGGIVAMEDGEVEGEWLIGVFVGVLEMVTVGVGEVGYTLGPTDGSMLGVVDDWMEGEREGRTLGSLEGLIVGTTVIS